jgi:hypothetical protein
MQLIYSAEVLLFSAEIPEHIDAFDLYQHEFKNSMVTELWFLLAQPCNNSHFYLLIVMDSVTSQVCFDFSKSFPSLMFHLHTSLMCWAN